MSSFKIHSAPTPQLSFPTPTRTPKAPTAPQATAPPVQAPSKESGNAGQVSQNKSQNYASFDFEKTISFDNEGGRSASKASSDKRTVAASVHKALGASEYQPESKLSQPVDLSTRASRLKALNQAVQIGPAKESDRFKMMRDVACGPQTILAGAVSKGKEGMQALFQVIEHHGQNHIMNAKAWDKLPDIKARAQNNTLTQNDLLTLQHIMHGQLKGMESDNTFTIGIDEIRDYIHTDLNDWNPFVDTEPLADVFSDMNIKLIDTDLDGGSDHFVLFFNDQGKGPENRVYDPWPSQSGNQITSDTAVYHRAVRHAVK